MYAVTHYHEFKRWHVWRQIQILQKGSTQPPFKWMKLYITKIAFLGLVSSFFVFVNCIFYHSTLGQMHYWWIHHSFCNHVFHSCLPIWVLNNLILNMQQHLGFYFKHRIPLWGTPLKLNFWTLIAKKKEDFKYIFYSSF